MKLLWVGFSQLCVSCLLVVATNAQVPAASAAKQQAPSATIVYRNTQYGFCFVLPASWKGYTVQTDQWNGWDTSTNEKRHGPIITIRNPKWTEQSPYQDIPIMIFTPAVWKLVDDGEIGVSAAPIGPSELGGNNRNVFALPPRWIGFTDAAGQDEVLALLSQHPFESPCGHKTPQPAKDTP